MAGPQSKCLSGGEFIHYSVPNKNKSPSPVYFNQVKLYMKEKYTKELEQFIQHFGEKEWWDILRKEMTDYTFDHEGNQCLFIYIKYRGFLNENKKKLSSEVCLPIQSVEEDFKQNTETS